MQTQRLYPAVMAALLALIIWALALEAGPDSTFMAELRLFGLAVVPIVAVTTLMAGFFEWRRGLQRRFMHDIDDASEAA
jgi:hypothetical protein